MNYSRRWAEKIVTNQSEASLKNQNQKIVKTRTKIVIRLMTRVIQIENGKCQKKNTRININQKARQKNQGKNLLRQRPQPNQTLIQISCLIQFFFLVIL